MEHPSSKLPLSQKLRQSPPFLRVAIAVLLVLLLVGAVPSYLRGRAPLSPAPEAPLRDLRQLGETGLDLADWTTLDRRSVRLGPHDWVMQTLVTDESERDATTVLFHAQPVQEGTASQPQMEWLDIRSIGRTREGEWNEDNVQHISFSVAEAGVGSADVTARYFRGWIPQQTWAIAQWYAWKDGGHPSLVRWFWRDRAARLVGQRVPWVAVCILMPIEPLGDIEAVRPRVEELAQSVQAALMRQGLTDADA